MASVPSALRRPRFGGAESPAASPRSPPSASSQPPSSPTPASSAADRERALQRKAARAVLVGRRDTLAYFDTVRALGQSVYIDVVPSVFNALYVVTVGNVALGNTTCLSAPLAMYTLGALVASYTLLALMAYLTLGVRVTVPISIPFILLSLWFCASGLWSSVFIVIQLFNVSVGASFVDNVAAGGSSACAQPPTPLLRGFAYSEMCISAGLAALVLVRWTGGIALRTTLAVGTSLVRRTQVYCRRSRVHAAVAPMEDSEGEAHLAAAAAGTGLSGGETVTSGGSESERAGSPGGSDVGSPVL